jgi:hypothetical protein
VRRLPFRLPETAPVVNWAGELARAVWEPRLVQVSRAFIITEREAILNGVRRAALQTIPEDQLAPLLREMAGKGLTVVPVTRTPRAEGYQSASRAALPGEAQDYRVVVARARFAAEFADAYQRGDDEAQGALLGFPACCRAFFRRVWTEERWFDTTVPSYRGHDISHGHVNMLWRWLGVRPVPHLPCSPVCADSAAFAQALRRLMPEQEGAWMDAVLSWPVKYTSLHGIAEITSPVLRLTVPTDALAQRHEIRHIGTGYPAEGAVGTDFPHQRPEVARPLLLTRRPRPEDNGFSSLDAQQAAHARLLACLSGPYGTVLDLGCGDGALLSRIPAQRRIGIEHDSSRARHARIDRVVVGDCTNAALLTQVLAEEQPDLILAQRDRNPPDTLPGLVLSYSYEPGAAPPALLTRET